MYYKLFLTIVMLLLVGCGGVTDSYREPKELSVSVDREETYETSQGYVYLFTANADSVVLCTDSPDLAGLIAQADSFFSGKVKVLPPESPNCEWVEYTLGEELGDDFGDISVWELESIE